MCHKLLWKIDLEYDRTDRPGAIKFVARPGRRTQKRDLIFTIDLAFSPTRAKLLAAARRKVSEKVSQISNEVNLDLLRTPDTEAETPDPRGL